MTREGSVDLDAILLQLGQFGRYQVQTYCFILLPIMFSAVYNSQFIFAASATEHRLDFYKEFNLILMFILGFYIVHLFITRIRFPSLQKVLVIGINNC